MKKLSIRLAEAYNKGFQDGLQGRTKEIEENKRRADARWAEVQIAEARLTGIMNLTRALHDLVQVATGGKH